MKMIVMVTGLVLLHPGRAAAASSTWEPLTEGLTETALTTLAVAPQDARLLYAASAHAIYVSRDGGMSWRASFRAPSSATVAFLAIDPFDERHVLAATSRGLYATEDGGEHWRRAVRAVGLGDAQCHVAAFHPTRRHEVLLGTAGGLWSSADGGRRWQRVLSNLPRHAVRDLAIDSREPFRVYALTDGGLFGSAGALDRWERLFESFSAEEEPTEDAEEPAEETESLSASSRRLTSVALDPHDPATVYLATSEGLAVSHDHGATWERISPVGGGATAIRHLALHAHSPTVAYAATPQGVARYHSQEQRWELLYAGLPTQGVNFVAATATKVYAATNQGLYSLDMTEELLAQGQWPPARELLGNFVHEPTIDQVQEQAIRYGEVHPEKIKRWRRQAALKALLPTVSLDYDRDQDTYISSIGSTTNPTFDRLIQTEDPSHGGSLSIDWDLGELIWNDDQTSIDVRSKLMVQLRDDILDEVTRTYFERRRLQVELLTAPPADPSIQLDKELRLQELTAMLDGLTGGWFSKQLEGNRPR